MTKDEHITIYSERYEALLAIGAIEDSVGGYNKLTTEDRFRVYCFMRVWSAIRFAESDRQLHFAKAIQATSDINLDINDRVMSAAFERFKVEGYVDIGRTMRSHKDYRGRPCSICGEPSVSKWNSRCYEHRRYKKTRQKKGEQK